MKATPLVARAGDTFPCGISAPHEDHLHGSWPRVHRCSGDTDTRVLGNGRRLPVVGFLCSCGWWHPDADRGHACERGGYPC